MAARFLFFKHISPLAVLLMAVWKFLSLAEPGPLAVYMNNMCIPKCLLVAFKMKMLF